MAPFSHGSSFPLSASALLPRLPRLLRSASASLPPCTVSAPLLESFPPGSRLRDLHALKDPSLPRPPASSGASPGVLGVLWFSLFWSCLCRSGSAPPMSMVSTAEGLRCIVSFAVNAVSSRGRQGPPSLMIGGFAPDATSNRSPPPSSGSGGTAPNWCDSVFSCDSVCFGVLAPVFVSFDFCFSFVVFGGCLVLDASMIKGFILTAFVLSFESGTVVVSNQLKATTVLGSLVSKVVLMNPVSVAPLYVLVLPFSFLFFVLALAFAQPLGALVLVLLVISFWVF